ncbi:CAP domain-containing protein [Pestalotiopsis sp. NC0098]|nr:CAP domain-containing protein [Pestalotiopsis sp. NC0098]
MQITFAALVRCSLVLSLPLAEARKCTKSRLTSSMEESESITQSSVASTPSNDVTLTTDTLASPTPDPTIVEPTSLSSSIQELMPAVSTTLESAISTEPTTPAETGSESATIPTTAATSTSQVEPAVTNQAYIDTVIRHHNVHRTNHSASAVQWSQSLADTARIIAESCDYRHNTSVNGGGYGQNIGAGFNPNAMGFLITEGFYNSEVNHYTAYGKEPNTTEVGLWGHFSQIVWSSTTSVGCYTQDCSATGLKNTGGGISPWFSVCNYAPAGNVLTLFYANVLPSVGNPTVFANYECPSSDNCENEAL